MTSCWTTPHCQQPHKPRLGQLHENFLLRATLCDLYLPPPHCKTEPIIEVQLAQILRFRCSVAPVTFSFSDTPVLPSPLCYCILLSPLVLIASTLATYAPICLASLQQLDFRTRTAASVVTDQFTTLRRVIDDHLHDGL